MRIGVISDTHGRLHDRVADVFGGVGHILHAGDVGGDDIIEALERIAPVTFVRGNNDDPTGEEVLRLQIGNLRVLMTHILPRPSAPDRRVVDSLRREPADVVVFGHSHLPHNERVGDIVYFNPASAGPRRFDYPIAVGVIEADGDSVRAYHVALDDRSVAALKTRMNQMQ